jgi:hypothetical protein
MFGKYRFNEVLFNYGAASGLFTVTANVPRYRLVLYESDATTVLYYLPTPAMASWYRRISEPSGLTLKYDATSASGAALTMGRWIKLFDETNNCIDSFRIQGRTRVHGSDIVEVSGEGALGELADQFINEATYPTSGGWTLRGVVNDLLGRQEDEAITLTLQFIADSLATQPIADRTFKRQSILEILRSLVAEFGGFLLCNAAGEIRWFATALDWRFMAYGFDYTGSYVHYLRPGKDIVSATVREDRSRLATRLYSIGVHEGIHLADPGYIEDATAKTAFGLIPRFVQNLEAETRTELALWTAKVLEWVKYPRYEIDLKAIDLTQAPASTDYHHIHLGHVIKADFPDMSVSVESPIFEITVDLLRAEQIDIRLAPINYGTGIPEVAGLSQQPYPLFSNSSHDNVGAVIATTNIPFFRKHTTGTWTRYEP